MGSRSSRPPAIIEEPPPAEVAEGSSKVIKAGENLSRFLPEVALSIIQKKTEQFELANALKKDAREATILMNTPIPDGDYSGLYLAHLTALYDVDDMEVAKLIVELTDDINKQIEPDEQLHMGGSPLHLCATSNNANFTTQILMKRSDVKIDLRDQQGLTALHRAILSGSTAVARLIFRKYPELVDQTVTPDADISDALAGMNCLHLAIVAAMKNPRNKRPALYSLVDFMLQNGADVNARDTNVGATPIHFAAARGISDMLYLMLNSRDINDALDDNAGLNALHSASIANELTSIKMLLMRGFDVNSRGARGETPVMVAAMSESIEALRLLIENGGDATLKDDTGVTALHYAAGTGSGDACFEVISNSEININVTDHNGGTALHTLAVRYTTLNADLAKKAAQILIDFGIDVDMADHFGNRAYKYLPADDQDAQTLFGKSVLFTYDTFHDRHLEDENQVRLPLGLPRLPVSRNWLQDMVKTFGSRAEEIYKRDYEKRLYYFPGEPRRTPPLERDPEWWASETTFPYTEANKILADRQDIGPRNPATVLPLGPHPLEESYDKIAPEYDHYGSVIYKEYQKAIDRSHEAPTKVRPDRINVEITKSEMLKRNYDTEVLDEQNQEEQEILDAIHNHKWWMRDDVRVQVDRLPAKERPGYVPGAAKDEMLLQPDYEFPPDVDIRNQLKDDVPPDVSEEWVRDPPTDATAAMVRRPPTATRTVNRDPNAIENIKFEDQWKSSQAADLISTGRQPSISAAPKTVQLYAPDGAPVNVIAKPNGAADVQVIKDPTSGAPIQVVEGPGGQAIRVYEAPNGQPVIMAKPNTNEAAIVSDQYGNAIRITNNVGRQSAATSSIVNSRLGSPTPRTIRDERPTRPF